MKVISIKDDPSIINFLKESLRAVPELHLLENYHPDYESTSLGNIFTIINKGRFNIGNYYVMITDDGEYAGSAGWNELDESTALALVRMYVPRKFRTDYIIGQHIFPKLVEETANYKHTWVTFNSYNKTIYNTIERIYSGKSSGLKPWPPVYRKFKPLGQKTVNTVLQYVAEYERSVP
jgi:hypothetical protein